MKCHLFKLFINNVCIVLLFSFSSTHHSIYSYCPRFVFFIHITFHSPPLHFLIYFSLYLSLITFLSFHRAAVFLSSNLCNFTKFLSVFSSIFLIIRSLIHVVFCLSNSLLMLVFCVDLFLYLKDVNTML